MYFEVIYQQVKWGLAMWVCKTLHLIAIYYDFGFFFFFFSHVNVVLFPGSIQDTLDCQYYRF